MFQDYKKFSCYSINKINNLYFQHPDAFKPESKIASLFSTNRPINNAIGSYISRLFNHRKTISIKELAAGPRSVEKWKYIEEKISISNLNVVLSDIINLDIPTNTQSNKLSLEYEYLDFFKPLKNLKYEYRKDVLITTYGFDSVWLAGDITYVKNGNTFYIEKYRLQIKSASKKSAQIIKSLETNILEKKLTLKDLSSIGIETKLVKTNLSANNFNKFITERLKSFNRGKLSFPGGMIEKIVEAFSNQISKDGIFIIGDTATVSNHQIKSLQDNAFGTSGVVEKFKRDDYSIVKSVLEKNFNFVVELYTIPKFVQKNLGKEWKNNPQYSNAEIIQIETLKKSAVMIVKNKSEKI